MEINRLLSSSVRLDCGSGQLAPLLLWRTCFRQVLGPLFIFSGELLFFSFYCERVWGWCSMPLGKPGPVTPLFVVPVWVGATPRVVMNTLIPPRLT